MLNGLLKIALLIIAAPFVLIALAIIFSWFN